MSVFESCEIESWRRCVSVLLRKGTCFWSAPRAAMTSPSADSDLLMFWASFSAWPVAPDLSMRSLPARSTCAGKRSSTKRVPASACVRASVAEMR